MEDKILEIVSKYDYRKGLKYQGKISFYKNNWKNMAKSIEQF